MDSSEYMECPYDKCHVILKKRMQVHLVKCRRNHLHERKVTCPFNVTHIMNKAELDFHVTVCTERKTLEHFRNVEQPVIEQSDAPTMPACESEENWDDDDTPSYNPSEYVAKAPVLRSIRGAAPSERKQFRKQERLRLLGINP